MGSGGRGRRWWLLLMRLMCGGEQLGVLDVVESLLQLAALQSELLVESGNTLIVHLVTERQQGRWQIQVLSQPPED